KEEAPTARAGAFNSHHSLNNVVVSLELELPPKVYTLGGVFITVAVVALPSLGLVRRVRMVDGGPRLHTNAQILVPKKLVSFALDRRRLGGKCRRNAKAQQRTRYND